MRLKIVLLGNLRTKLYIAGHCRVQSGDIQHRQTQDTLGPTTPRLVADCRLTLRDWGLEIFFNKSLCIVFINVYVYNACSNSFGFLKNIG